MTKTIPQLTAATLPVDSESLMEISIPGGGSRKLALSSLAPVIDLTGTTMTISNFPFAVSQLTFDPFGLTALALPDLEKAAGQLQVNIPTLTSLDISKIKIIGNGLGVFCNQLVSLDINLLVYVGKDFDIETNLLTTLQCNALQYVGNGFTIQGTNLGTCSCPALITTGSRGFILRNQSLLTSISAPLLATLGDKIDISNTPVLTTVNFSGLLHLAGDFFADGSALLQASVDGILVKLAALDGTAGTTSYDNQDVDLSGGTSASPSATGLAAKAVLEGRGNSVTVN